MYGPCVALGGIFTGSLADPFVFLYISTICILYLYRTGQGCGRGVVGWWSAPLVWASRAPPREVPCVEAGGIVAGRAVPCGPRPGNEGQRR